MFEWLSNFIINTPDFGHSDVWHFNFPLKFFLGEALKNGYLPMWSKDIGMGFPLLGEGQIGLFNPINLFLFKFFSTPVAFNLSFMLVILITFLGSYFFARQIKLGKLASIFAVITFSLSGVFVTQFNHLNLIQASSIIPWIFLFAERIIQNCRKRDILFLSLAIFLQVSFGFMQLVLISLISSGLYFLLRIQTLPFKIKPILFVFLGIILGFSFSFPQIIASYQISDLSFRKYGLGLPELVRFPFNFLNFLGFLFPYAWGDPRFGTYPTFSSNWGIFWESTGYVGFLTIFLAPLAFLSKWFRNYSKLFLILILICTILLLGKFTPFFFIYQIFPLSLFRVPARFIIPFVWILCILSAIGLDFLSRKFGHFSYLIFAIIIFDLASFSLSYNSFIPINQWLSPPESVSFLKNDKSWFRIFAINPYDHWNKIFTNYGWQNMEAFLDFRNALDPNQNLLWGISSADVYSGITTRRFDLWKNAVLSGIETNYLRNEVRISSNSAKLLSISGIKYLTSPFLLSNDSDKNFYVVATTSGSTKFQIIKNNYLFPHAFLTRNYKVAESIGDLNVKLINPLEKAIIIEKEININFDSNADEVAYVSKNSDLEVVVEANASKDSILVLTDSFYPGWYAYIDKSETEIFPVNINSRGVVFPKGKHKVIFKYEPYKFFKLPWSSI